MGVGPSGILIKKIILLISQADSNELDLHVTRQ